MAYVNEFFYLSSDSVKKLRRLKPKFGGNGFGEIVFYRTYSRIKADGGQEDWHDVVIRCINGTMSIRKDWYIKNFIDWDEAYWQAYAYRMAVSMFKMQWMPGGRGMWVMGTKFMYERGSMALNNCGFTKLGDNHRFSDDVHWMMDALMLGVGVGFEPLRTELKVYVPQGTYIHYVQDTREGWCDATKLLIDAYTKPGMRLPIFKYDLVREKGKKINGFGGKASGPGPLKLLHEQIVTLFTTPGIDVVRLKADIANMVGVCVVAGNVRRSAELCKGKITDQVFLDLKDYELYPEREDWGGLSNNSVGLFEDEDFELLGEVAKRVVVRGEPGVMNLRNFKYGRIGKPIPVREDDADGLNPCGEVPLKDKELCNVAETLPTVCRTVTEWYEACEFATFYASCVSLLPTHRPETNAIVVKNRRIAVGIIDWSGWILEEGLHKVTAFMRRGYDVVTKTNQLRNAEAGVPEAIRKTTIKPGGTGPKLPGKTPGIGNPPFRETLRRLRVAVNNPICPVLDAANIPFEPCFFDPSGTRIYEYPLIQGPAEPAEEVTLWEQAMNLVTVQREWADNAVSNTLYFKPYWKLICSRSTFVRNFDPDPEVMRARHEEQYRADFPGYVQESLGSDVIIRFDNPGNHTWQQIDRYKVVTKLNKYGSYELAVYVYDPHHEEKHIEKVLSAITPLTKSYSLLPHTAKGAYRQMPEEGITLEEYERRSAAIGPIDWSAFRDSDGIDERYCQGEACLVTNGPPSGPEQSVPSGADEVREQKADA